MYNEVYALLKVNGWDCTFGGSKPEDDYCSVNSNCRNFVQDFPTFSMVFYQNEGAFPAFDVSIYPEIYLFEDSEDHCQCLFREVNNATEHSFVLGTPFFRNFSIYLDYIDNSIAVVSKTVDSPISMSYPGYSETAKMELGLTYISGGQYQGPVYVVTPVQGDETIAAYSSNSFYSIIPQASNANVKNGWFESGDSSTFSTDATDIKVVEDGMWGAVCQMSTD